MEAEEIRAGGNSKTSRRRPLSAAQPPPPPPYLGVTPPLSMDPPTAVDLAATAKLEARMRALGSYETGDMCRAREEVGGVDWWMMCLGGWHLTKVGLIFIHSFIHTYIHIHTLSKKKQVLKLVQALANEWARGVLAASGGTGWQQPPPPSSGGDGDGAGSEEVCVSLYGVWSQDEPQFTHIFQ
jgi:hypothetical protein